MADDDRASKIEIEHENKMIRRLRFLVELTFATIAQDNDMTLELGMGARARAQGRRGCDVPRQGRDLRPGVSAALLASARRAIRRELKLSGLIAKPDGSIVRGHVTFADRITALDPASDGGDDYILPGFVDLQVNGSHGIDVMNASPDALATLSRHLAREGATAWMPTAVTAPLEKIAQVHESIATAIENSRRNDSSDAAAILGMHLEGPFISPLRLGAHPTLNLEPRGDAFERVLAMRALRLITLAPELPGGTRRDSPPRPRATWSFPSAIPTRLSTRRTPASTPARGCSRICSMRCAR